MKEISNTFNYEITCLSSRFKYVKWYLAMLDAIKSKLYFPIPIPILFPEKVKKTRKLSEKICYIDFSNKAVEFINPSAIFNKINVKSKSN